MRFVLSCLIITLIEQNEGRQKCLRTKINKVNKLKITVYWHAVLSVKSNTKSAVIRETESELRDVSCYVLTMGDMFVLRLVLLYVLCYCTSCVTSRVTSCAARLVRYPFCATSCVIIE